MSPTMPSPDWEDILAVGIDIGSTYTMVAIKPPGSQARDQDIECFNAWPGYRSSADNMESALPQIPSDIYWPENGDPVIGRLAWAYTRNPNYNPRRHVVNWKSAFNPNSNTLPAFEAQASYLGLDVEMFALNTFYLDLHEGRLKWENIRIVFPKPPEMVLKSYRPLMNAAVKLGFQESQIGFASESESFLRGAALKSDNKIFDSLETGDIIIPIDAGGCSIDFGAYMLVGFKNSKPRFKQVGPLPCSDFQGSETVVQKFKVLLKDLFVSQGRYNPETIDGFVASATENFAVDRSYVNIDDQNQKFSYKLPGIRRAPSTCEGVIFENDTLILTAEIFRKVYAESINSFQSKLEAYIRKCPKLPNLLLFGGGYTLLPYFRDRMMAAFKQEMDIPCRFENVPKPLVAKGAIHLLTDPSFTESLLSKHSHCIMTLKGYNALEQKKFPTLDFQQFKEKDGIFFMAYEWLRKKGEEISTNQDLTVDANDWRYRDVDDVDELEWTETILTFDSNPGLEHWSLPLDPRFLDQEIDEIKVRVDLRPYYSDNCELQSRENPCGKRKKGKRPRFQCINYALYITMDGEIPRYWITFNDPKAKEEKHLMLEVLEAGDGFQQNCFRDYGTCPRISSKLPESDLEDSSTLMDLSEGNGTSSDSVQIARQMMAELKRLPAADRSTPPIGESPSLEPPFLVRPPDFSSSVDDPMRTSNAEILKSNAEILQNALDEPDSILWNRGSSSNGTPIPPKHFPPGPKQKLGSKAPRRLINEPPRRPQKRETRTVFRDSPHPGGLSLEATTQVSKSVPSKLAPRSSNIQSTRMQLDEPDSPLTEHSDCEFVDSELENSYGMKTRSRKGKGKSVERRVRFDSKDHSIIE